MLSTSEPPGEERTHYPPPYACIRLSNDSPEERVKAPGGIGEILPKLNSLFEEAGFDHSRSTHSFGPENGILLVYTGITGWNATVQTFVRGRVTANIQIPVDAKNNCIKNELDINLLSKSMKTLLQAGKWKLFPPVNRCALIDRYIPNTCNQWAEYDFDRCVFEEDSPFQHIKILHSIQYGNVLVLDDDINMGESDLVYTLAITGNGREDFTGKEVLVLGGGDGGVLHELRQKSPEFITMVEIDQVVIEAAQKHLRGICHDSLDQLQGENYKVLIEDCIPVLEAFVKEGKTFDYVINDLTAIPITQEPRGSQWDFMRYILDLSMRVLKPSGKYFTQGNSLLKKSALAMYEDQLNKLHCTVRFSRETVCVPSYMEMWVFYEIWKVT